MKLIQRRSRSFSRRTVDHTRPLFQGSRQERRRSIFERPTEPPIDELSGKRPHAR